VVPEVLEGTAEMEGKEEMSMLPESVDRHRAEEAAELELIVIHKEPVHVVKSD
jgi:hypothetical protein